MTDTEKAAQDQFIRDVICQTAKRFPLGMTFLTLQTCLRSVLMYNVADSDLELHLRYLESANFIEQMPKRTPQNRLWKITADGLDDLAARGM